MRRRQALLATAALGLACMLTGGASVDAASLTDDAHRVDPPQPLPPLIYEDDLGQQHSLQDLRGRYVLLNIWASWCDPCVREMPSLAQLQEKIPLSRLTVLPLAEDHAAGKVAAFYQQHRIRNLPLAVDHAGRATAALRLRGLPTSLLIDPQGREIARIEGDEDWTSPFALQFIKDALAR